jgi:hypothetical protein
MKKVAIYYSNKFGRNDGSPLYYYNVLKQNKEFDTYHLIPEGDTSNFGKFDYHFWVDWGEDGLPWPEWSIPKDGGKTIYVASDTHLGREYRLNKAKQFDYAFFNQKDAAEEAGGVWLPHAAEPMAYPKIDIIKKYDVCFIGHIQDVVNYNGFTRTDALDRLFKEIPNFYYGSRHPAFPDRNLFEDAGKKFSQSKIVFNISIKDDYNMRCNEVMMTGSFLLTNWIPIFDDLEREYGMIDGVHFVTYKTLDEMVEKAKYYLEHDEERQKIADAGYDLAIKKMTYKNRIETIFEVIGEPIE